MTKQITMADIMTPIDQYVHVPFWYSIREAMAALNKGPKREGCLSTDRVVLVFDNAYNLVGAVRRLNLLQGLEPSFLHTGESKKKGQRALFTVADDVSLSVVDVEQSQQNMRRRSERPIEDVLSPLTETLKTEDPIIKAVFKMAKVDVGVIPVLEDNSVVGIVTVDELFKAVSTFVL
jgi:CBS-domain-containing membrane protein